MALSNDQKALLFKDPQFLQQAGVKQKTPEQLSGTVNQADIKSQFDALKARHKKPKLTPITPVGGSPFIAPEVEQKKPSFLQKLGLSLISSEKALADTYETAIASRSDDYSEALESQSGLSDNINKLFLQIHKMESEGRDTTRAKEQFRNITGVDFKDGLQEIQNLSAGNILGQAAEKNTKQIVGESLGVITDIAGAGTLGKARSIKTVGQGIKAGATTGAAYGLSSGVAEGMKEDKDLKGILKTGAKGAATGAVVGGIVGGVSGKISQNKANKATRELNKARQALQPPMNKKQRLLAAEEGRITRDITGTARAKGIPTRNEDIAEELSGVLKAKRPETNMQYLKNDLNKTEERLTKLLAKDKTPVIKRSVGDTLDSLKDDIPLGFRSDTSMKNAYDNAIDLAKDIVNKKEPTIAGLRNARTAFDQSFKKQFPNAIKGGTIDQKTAAGSAYKTVRDALNNYMYQTASVSNQKLLPNLIRREALNLRAQDIIKEIGADELTKLSRRRRLLNYGTASGIGAATGAAGIGAYQAIK